jgi:hypothetical protein
MTDFTEAHSFFPQSHRLLEDEAIPPNDSEVLRNTFMVYGSILICIFLLFCFVRQKFPRPYKLRSWVEDLKVNTFEMMRDEHWGAIFEIGSARDPQDAPSSWTTKPLANILTELKHTLTNSPSSYFVVASRRNR